MPVYTNPTRVLLIGDKKSRDTFTNQFASKHQATQHRQKGAFETYTQLDYSDADQSHSVMIIGINPTSQSASSMMIKLLCKQTQNVVILGNHDNIALPNGIIPTKVTDTDEFDTLIHELNALNTTVTIDQFEEDVTIGDETAIDFFSQAAQQEASEQTTEAARDAKRFKVDVDRGCASHSGFWSKVSTRLSNMFEKQPTKPSNFTTTSSSIN